MLQKHLDAIMQMEWVNADAIAAANFKVVVDAVNSTGAIAVPAMPVSYTHLDVYKRQVLSCDR